jgi:hypothetical protein
VGHEEVGLVQCKRVVPWSVAILFSFGVGGVTPSRAAAQCCGSEQCDGDFNCDSQVTVDEVIVAVNNVLNGCSAVGADQACADAATASCAKLDQCVLHGSAIRYGDASVCQARQKQACLVRLGATGTGNNPAAVESCAGQTPSASCNEFDEGGIPECQAKIGTMANGAACAFPGQCESANCAIVTGTNCGTCTPPNQAGDSCATTSCSAGLQCVKSSQQCQPRGTGGDACDTDHPCGAGLSCVTPAAMPSGTCRVAGNTLNAPCDPKHQNAPGCDPNAGLYCDSGTNTCLATAYVTAGAQCGTVNHMLMTCTDASTCFGAQGQTPGTCIADAANGMPCDTDAGPSCIGPARCVTGGPAATAGVCRLPDPTKCT